jgi:hypothetical protein
MSIRHGCRAAKIAPVVLLFVTTIHAEETQPVDFSRQIRPLLSNSCFACHGPDRNGQDNDLRLDVRDEALESAIVPGDSESSELLARLVSDDPDLQMPPPGVNTPRLSAEEIALVRRWVDEGAQFSTHWSYSTLQRPTVPQVDSDWPLNPIDHFVFAQNQERSVAQAADADRRTLIRRLSFDLLGLVPNAKRVEEFVESDTAEAYEELVDELLESEHFGERMASFWLDLVRFADTCGYHGDQHRQIAAYRDFVIEAFNSNMPFDKFTVYQIAGDLIPNASQQQRIASGYNRLLQTTEEGGAQPKEYRAIYAADRVRNVSTVWLGTTLGCAQCHDHKFDPFTMHEFYRFAAFFADIEEAAVGRQQANLALPTAEQTAKLAELRHKVDEIRSEIKGAESKKKSDDAADKQAIESTLSKLRADLKPLEAEIKSIDGQIRRTLVSKSITPRVMRVLPRGNWLDETGPTVEADIPSLFGSLRSDGSVPSRTHLARWITSRDNPLTARVIVNHFWRLMFGEGLTRTPDDFGHQGEYPTHNDLLDWLATEFIASEWNVKQIIRLIVTSRTYRQNSITDSRLDVEDPQNNWLARQNRFRLDAEMIRDNALSVGGLLVRQVGGESVKPYQPAGYWAQLNFPKRKYQADQGTNQYRRGVYTYWCRTFLHPSLAAFDAPTREECTAQRPRSNTPLQALVLLNDPTYVEAARKFGERILNDAPDGVDEKIHWALNEAVQRRASQDEMKILKQVFSEQLVRYRHDVEAANQLASVGQSQRNQNVDVAELGAWTSVARILLNLHETITRY